MPTYTTYILNGWPLIGIWFTCIEKTDVTARCRLKCNVFWDDSHCHLIAILRNSQVFSKHLTSSCQCRRWCSYSRRSCLVSPSITAAAQKHLPCLLSSCIVFCSSATRLTQITTFSSIEHRRIERAFDGGGGSSFLLAPSPPGPAENDENIERLAKISLLLLISFTIGCHCDA